MNNLYTRKQNRNCCCDRSAHDLKEKSCKTEQDGLGSQGTD